MCTLKYILYDWGGYNKIISQSIHSNATYKPLVILSKFITQMGNFYIFPIHLLLVLGVFLIILRMDKKQSMQKSVSYMKCLSLLLLNILVGVVVFKTMKIFFNYPRPYCVPDFSIKEYLLHFFKYAREMCNHSFPSGHTAYICLFVMSFWSILNKNLKMIGILIMLLVGISRVVLAKHFIADITYSYLIVLIIINPFNSRLIDKYFPKCQPVINKTLKKYLKIFILK